MKYIVITLFIFLYLLVPIVEATNTHSAYFVRASSQQGILTEASKTGGFDFTGDFAMSFWMNATATVTTAMNVMSNGQDADASYQLRKSAAGKIRMMFTHTADYSAFTDIRTTGKVDRSGVWKFYEVDCDVSIPLCLIYEGDASTPPVATSTTVFFSGSTSVRNPTYDFRMGSNANNIGSYENFFNGYLDDVRIWTNATRTVAQIQADYNCSLDGTETNLLANWKLDNNFNDASSTPNNLTNTNSVAFDSTTVPYTASCTVAPAAAVTQPPQLPFFWFF